MYFITVRQDGEDYRLPEAYYFSGDCAYYSSEIAENFIRVLKKEDMCVEDKWCKVENVNVKCGDLTEDEDSFFNEDDDYKRRKRSTRRGSRRRGSRRRGSIRRRKRRNQYIAFDIVTRNDKTGGNFKNNVAIHNRKLRSIAKKTVKLQFYAAGRMIKADMVRVWDTMPVCAPGLKIGARHKDSCGECLD